MDLLGFFDLTFWQKLYLIGTIAGMVAFIHIIGWITDEVRRDYKGFIAHCSEVVHADIEKSKRLLRGG